jgi:DNA-binding transcriptional MerR regulator
MDELLTLKEIAARLGIPESNLRYYRNKIGEFLPSAGAGRRRRYFPEAVEIFRRAVDLVSEGVSLDRIYKNLAADRPPEIESIGAVSQEAFINKIAERVAEKVGASGARGEADGEKQLLKERVREQKEELAREKARAAALEKATEQLARAEGVVKRLQSEIGGLKEALDRQSAETDDLRRRMSEKENIIEQQKAQLIDARSKRMNVEQELASIRVLLERIAGPAQQ